MAADANLASKVAAQARRNRRQLRRAVHAMASYATRRARTHVWLETHLWHAKRMHMHNVWGHRLAAAPNDRYTTCGLRIAPQVTSESHDCDALRLSFSVSLSLSAEVNARVIEQRHIFVRFKTYQPHSPWSYTVRSLQL